MSSCYEACNKKFNFTDVGRTFCKKGCDSDEDKLDKCKNETCGSVCIKQELGEDDSKLGKWSYWLSRAPKDPTHCLSSCIYGCNNKNLDDDEE